MKVIISSPYASHSLHGNTVSAVRIAGMLEECGHVAEVVQSGDFIAKDAGALIALHARKSHAAIMMAKGQSAECKVILYLTGTDLYEDIPAGCPLALESLGVADAVVVSQGASFGSVPARYQKKTRVVYNSINIPKLDGVERELDLFVIASHLRAVKQPFLVVEALGMLDCDVRVKLLGAEIDEGSAERGRELMQGEGRFEWLGEQSYKETLSWMQRSVVTINTSLAEGGANSVGESIVLGRAVLASRVEGNVGMLGEGYDGYFDAGSAGGLAELMRRVRGESGFLAHLEGQVRVQSEKYSRENERKGWLALL